MSLEKHYTATEIAEAMGVTNWTVGQWVKRGLVTPLRIDGRPNAPMRFTQADYEQLRNALAPAVVEPTRKRRRRRAA